MNFIICKYFWTSTVYEQYRPKLGCLERISIPQHVCIGLKEFEIQSILLFIDKFYQSDETFVDTNIFQNAYQFSNLEKSVILIKIMVHYVWLFAMVLYPL